MTDELAQAEIAAAERAMFEHISPGCGCNLSAMARAAVAAASRVREERGVGDGINKFRAMLTIGFDKNGEADFRASMAIASLDRPMLDELCRMTPWAIKEALEIWLRHGPHVEEAKQLAASQGDAHG